MSWKDSLWQGFRNAKTPHNHQKPTSCPSAPGNKKCAWLLFIICKGHFPSAMVSYSKRRNINLFDKVGRREKKGESSALMARSSAPARRFRRASIEGSREEREKKGESSAWMARLGAPARRFRRASIEEGNHKYFIISCISCFSWFKLFYSCLFVCIRGSE